MASLIYLHHMTRSPGIFHWINYWIMIIGGISSIKELYDFPGSFIIFYDSDMVQVQVSDFQMYSFILVPFRLEI